jgi:hypothetical protein
VYPLFLQLFLDLLFHLFNLFYIPLAGIHMRIQASLCQNRDSRDGHDAHNQNAPTCLLPKAKIEINHVILVLSGQAFVEKLTATEVFAAHNNPRFVEDCVREREKSSC